MTSLKLKGHCCCEDSSGKAFSREPSYCGLLTVETRLLIYRGRKLECAGRHIKPALEPLSDNWSSVGSHCVGIFMDRSRKLLRALQMFQMFQS